MQAWKSPRILDCRVSLAEPGYRSRRECPMNSRLQLNESAEIVRRELHVNAVVCPPVMLNAHHDAKMQSFGVHAHKKTPLPLPEAAFFVFKHRKRRIPCPWQAWQRPTLPGLKP